MKLPNTSLQVIELNPSCLGQAHSNRPGTGPGYKNMEPESVFTILHIPSTVYPLKSTDAKSNEIV